MHSLDLCITVGLLLSVAVAAENEISRSILIILSPTCNCLLSLLRLTLVYLFLIFGGAYLLLSWWVLGVILIFKILDHLQNARPAILQSRLV